MTRRIGIFLAALFCAALVLEAGASFQAQGRLGISAPAEARVGRPLTPVSVAGVGRRTVRRCAVGVYYC